MITINYWAVLVAAVAQMFLGWLWYGPIFGKPWAAMMGFTPEKIAEAKAKGNAGMAKSYALMFVGALLMAWILAHAITFAAAYSVGLGITVGLLCWLGFIAPVMLGSVLWEGKSWKLWILNTGYYLVGLCMMGAILAIWMNPF